MIIKIMRVSFLSIIMISTSSVIYAAGIYGKAGIDCGHANHNIGILTDLAMGGVTDSGLGGGFDLSFSDNLGYDYDPEMENGDSNHLNFLSFGPQFNYILMPLWPVNISFSVNGGPGWIGVENDNSDGDSILNDAILLIKGRVSLNFLLWNNAGFYIGCNYVKVFRSQNLIFTNEELSGFEISFGLTGYLSGTPSE